MASGNRWVDPNTSTIPNKPRESGGFDSQSDRNARSASSHFFSLKLISASR
jgi:hypothetical protein